MARIWLNQCELNRPHAFAYFSLFFLILSYSSLFFSPYRPIPAASRASPSVATPEEHALLNACPNLRHYADEEAFRSGSFDFQMLQGAVARQTKQSRKQRPSSSRCATKFGEFNNYDMQQNPEGNCRS